MLGIPLTKDLPGLIYNQRAQSNGFLLPDRDQFFGHTSAPDWHISQFKRTLGLQTFSLTDVLREPSAFLAYHELPFHYAFR